MKIIKGITKTVIATTKDQFETEDGQIFSNEKDAIIHEDELKIKNTFIEKYKVRDIDQYNYGIDADSDCTVTSIYIENLEEETINDLKIFYPYLKTYDNWIKNIKTGINIIIIEESDSCFIGKWSGYYLYILSLDDLIKSKTKELDNMKELRDNYLVEWKISITFVVQINHLKLYKYENLQ